MEEMAGVPLARGIMMKYLVEIDAQDMARTA